MSKPGGHVSEAPTNPASPAAARPAFDVATLYRGPAAVAEVEAVAAPPLDEKLRQAYFWIVNQAILSPHYDIEYNDAGPAPPRYSFGGGATVLTLPSGQSYSSFVLLPLLNFAVRRRCLLVGGPGRGKTASAILMGVLAGYTLREVRRGIQHGQPQMTIADLLGNPLPADLVGARSMDAITIAWRRWLDMRVKIIDEYNRIPTRTQSALLTIMADNYAEILDHVFECPEAAWYLTANDDAGGGTYQVIEALRDRIDIVVKALPFNSRFLGELLARVEQSVRPEEVVPPEIVFTPAEVEAMSQAVLGVAIPGPVARRFEFFVSQFEFCPGAGVQVEYQTKDTVKLSGVDAASLLVDGTRDPLKDLGSQTKNGLSVRAMMTALVFVKAMAWFRGERTVALEDMRQILPFVLHDKLVQNSDSPFFDAPGNGVLRVDKVSWIRRLFDLACQEYDRLDLDRDDPVGALDAELREGLAGVGEAEVEARLARIERLLGSWEKGDARKLYGHLYDDLLKLKSLHQRYTNYLRWVKWKG